MRFPHLVDATDITDWARGAGCSRGAEYDALRLTDHEGFGTWRTVPPN